MSPTVESAIGKTQGLFEDKVDESSDQEYDYSESSDSSNDSDGP